MTVDSPSARSELAEIMLRMRGALMSVGLASGVVNVLSLTGSIFMMQIYDRVLPSRSIGTLLGLSALAIVLYSFQGALEVIRTRLLSRIGGAIEADVNERVYNINLLAPLRGRPGELMTPMRDLDQLKAFFSSVGLPALFDLPWIPLYLAICFVFNVWLGVLATGGAAVLVWLTILTEQMSKAPVNAAARLMAQRLRMSEAHRRNAEVLQAMGFRPAVARRWVAISRDYTQQQLRASDVGGSLSGLSRVLRLVLQSALLALGALLVINGKASGGVIFASSMMMTRALAPVDLAIANWRNFQATRNSWTRLREVLRQTPPEARPLAMPPPSQSLSVAALTLVPPGERRVVLDGASFALRAGQGLGIVGPSGSGKSSLARALVGVWQPVRGEIRLDNATFDRWSNERLGRAIGYLPQDVELFEGSILENISRFEIAPEAERVLAAAKAASVHDLILRLPEGYETQIGEGGVMLSAGQRQRIGLARALYGDPFLVVLDEPNANLDAEGEDALVRAIAGVRERGGIPIVIAHRPQALAALDQVLVLKDGRQQALGPRDDILKQLMQPAVPARTAQ
jgi:ATP-binding cassette subfamily C protein